MPYCTIEEAWQTSLNPELKMDRNVFHYFCHDATSHNAYSAHIPPHTGRI